jgi:hypothetical protein
LCNGYDVVIEKNIYKVRIDLCLRWYGIKSKTNGLCGDNDCETNEITDNLVCSLIKKTLSILQ